MPAPRLTPFALGFRPFFLGSAVYAALGMGAWIAAFRGVAVPGTDGLGPAMWWHAHAMVFGYSIGVIAGFLLTAVQNWTGIKTLHGWPLALLFSTWAAARVMPHLGAPLAATALVDVLFDLALLAAVTVPLLRARRWRDAATFGPKLLALAVANTLVYLAAMGIGSALRTGLYLGLYVVLAVVLTIGSRVFAFFIERGIGDGLELPRAPGLALASLASFLGFVVVDLLWPASVGSGVLAACVAVVNARRLWLWNQPGVWSRPLLWVLVVGYAWIIVGFALYALAAFGQMRPHLALHALTVGGVGMVTLGMMARISLGHTGRNVQQPPRALRAIFGALSAAVLVRVLLPLANVVDYTSTVLAAQVLWAVAFAAFVVVYAPILVAARIDGKPG
jgi:uncharacterized protein involved in response to NO